MHAPRTPSPRRAFTLAEMVVVVALIAVLTVGIGRLFAGVSNAVSRGLAASDLDAAARAIENALRTDFERVNDMQSEDTFFVIRAVELGGDPDRPIYLTSDDREADVLEGIAPYDPGSRAIHTRLDEMAFLSAVPGVTTTFRSQQDAGFFTAGAPAADAARIYYGHGLRPKLGPARELPDGTLADPLRQFVSDGWFGSPPGDDGRDYLPDGTIGGRNQFASDWILARQALLLYGAEATGRADPDNGEPQYQDDREYAPYIRDLETLNRFWGDLLAEAPGGPDNYTWPGPVNPAVTDNIARPDPRLIMHGRVDVCAQSLTSVRRWLEGEAPVWNPADNAYTAPPYEPIASSAFGVDSPELQPDIDGNRYGLSANDLRGTANEFAVQRWLWRRAADPDTTEPSIDPATPGLLNIGPTDRALDDLTYNYIGIRSALAGVLTRPLVELRPSPESRADPRTLAAFNASFQYAQEHDASMDTHAVLAARCSRFEIAWADGSTWNREIDFDGDAVPEVRAGDLVWFDPTRLDPRNEVNDDSAVRMTYEFLQDRYPAATNAIKWLTAYSDPDELDLDRWPGSLGDVESFELTLNPEVGYGDADYFDSEPTFQNASVSPLARRLKIARADDDPTVPNGVGDRLPFYNPDISGGAPSIDGWPDADPASPSNDINEYLAIWPFRVPTSTGEWGEQFEKDILIRVRFTLHDPQGRLDEGRDYEVILQMHPRDEHG